MTGHAVQSEAGNITVFAHGNFFLIWVDGVGYITDNPLLSDRAIEIEYSSNETPEQIKAKIDKAHEQNGRRRY
jgi:hypothetical protein